MKKYICTVCDWIYDPEIGDPEGGIEPGTAFEDIPESWVCPVCGVGEELFGRTREQQRETGLGAVSRCHCVYPQN